MKKLALLLALVLVLSLSLTACGQEERYPDIADLLDAGKFDAAIEKIEAMKPTEKPTDAPTDPTDPPTDPEPAVNPALQEQLNDLIYFADLITRYYYPSRFGFSYHDGTERLELEGMDAMAWVYETALELAPQFPEAQKIVDGFTLMENQLLSVYPWYEDALGNIVDRNTTYYDYQADGSLLPSKNDTYDILCPPDDYAVNYGITEYTYDDSGKPISVRYYTDEKKEKVRCVMEYGYDENDFLITQHYLDAGGNEFNTVYENNEKGLPIRAEDYPYLRNSIPEPGTAYFTHDDQGRLISISIESQKHYNSFGRLTRDYVYDEAGNLISVRRYHKDIFDNPNQGRGYQDVEVWNYFYDEAGTPLYHTYTDYVVCDDDGTPLKEDIITYTVDYTYGTYYIYTPVE